MLAFCLFRELHARSRTLQYQESFQAYVQCHIRSVKIVSSPEEVRGPVMWVSLFAGVTRVQAASGKRAARQGGVILLQLENINRDAELEVRLAVDGSAATMQTLVAILDATVDDGLLQDRERKVIPSTLL